MAGRGGNRKNRKPGGASSASASKPVQPACWSCGKPISPGLKKCPNCKARQGWRRWVFGAPGAIVGVALGASAIWSAYTNIIHKFKDADVTADLTTCRADEIVVAVANAGGRPATLGRPEITLESPMASPDPLRMEGFLEVGADPFRDHADLAGDEHDVISYDHPVAPFYGPEDLRGGRCEIKVRLTVTPEAGRPPHRPVDDSCSCGS